VGLPLPPGEPYLDVFLRTLGFLLRKTGSFSHIMWIQPAKNGYTGKKTKHLTHKGSKKNQTPGSSGINHENWDFQQN